MEVYGHPPGTYVAEIELVYKSKVKSSDRVTIMNSHDAYQVFLCIWDMNKLELYEEFKVLYINRANKLLAVSTISIGGITATVADPRIIFVAALKIKATSLMLAHNHPSGNLKPSRADEEMTQKFKYAGQFLEITILDHLIISNEGYYSFSDEGAI